MFLDYPLEEDGEIRSFAVGPHPVLTFVLSGMSKIAGLPQMKVAWIAAFGPEAVRRQALGRLEVIADTFLSMNAPVQLALPVWMDERGEIQVQILERVRGNLAVCPGEWGGGAAGGGGVVRDSAADAGGGRGGGGGVAAEGGCGGASGVVLWDCRAGAGGGEFAWPGEGVC